MPNFGIDGISLPSLKTYICSSIAALSACIFYALYVVKDTKIARNVEEDGTNLEYINLAEFKRSLKYAASDIFTVLMKESICVWILINMSICCLIILGRAIQKLVFGELRISEQQQLREKFWNFLFYKFIFIFGVINVQYIDEVLFWCSWFSFLGFLHLLSQLCKDRYEYLTFSPRTPIWSHVKLMTLVMTIFILSNGMLLAMVFVGFYNGINTFAFMVSEVLLLSLQTLYIIIKYSLHLLDAKNEESMMNQNENPPEWEKKGPLVYYISLTFEMTLLFIDLVHHIHMLLWSNVFLSMASLVICMQLRYLFHKMKRKYNKHRNYIWVRNHLEQNYPMASEDEIKENSDNCAICWEKMKAARKLPCSHMFHNICLVSWLEQDTSCPTCRLSLNISTRSTSIIETPEHISDVHETIHRPLNHFFHFDGSRYVSWLPSFSVEVSHSNAVTRQSSEVINSQMNEMARRVQQLFPSMPLSVIIDDLRVTRSVEVTVENILDGRIPVSLPIFREIEAVQPSAVFGVPQNYLEVSDITTKWEDINEDTDVSEDIANLGSRFSKSSSEREKILHTRKENLLKLARKRYIEKQKAVAKTKLS